MSAANKSGKQAPHREALTTNPRSPHGAVTVTLEAEISPGMSPGDFVDLAVRCEQAGLDDCR